MKSSLKNTLLAVTMLSTGFFVLSAGQADAAGYKKAKAKDAVAQDTSFQQYPKLGQVKDDVNSAVNLHTTAVSLISDKQQLEQYKDAVEKYNEIERRLAQNVQCNISQLSENFTDGANVWKKVSAWAEDSAETLLAEASGSLTDPELSKQLAAVESGDTSSVKSSESKYSAINADTSTEAAMAMVKSDTASTESQSSDMNIDEAAAYGKVRWDVGYTVLKNIYASPSKWGTVKKQYLPWIDQKRVYDVYLNNYYAELESHYVANPLRPFPKRPTMADGASYLPADYYSGTLPEPQVSSKKYDEKKATLDEKWCGETDGMQNICQRVNKGGLYRLHTDYVAALQRYPLKKGEQQPQMLPPYLPQRPLPPWRESAYIMKVEKNIADIASNLPDPWYKVVAQSVDNFAPKGEFSNLVERNGKSVRFRHKDYDSTTLEVKTNSDGTPRLPVPLMTNRVSAYLALTSAKAEQEPVKERALASIKELSENIVSTLAQAGYTVPNPDTFDLSKDEDYKAAMNKLAELQNAKISAARSKIQSLQASFGGKLLPSVAKMVEEEKRTMDALQKDSEFLVNVSRDNAPNINSLLLTAVADATANQTYKENLAEKTQDLAPVPPVGCPVL